jgi:glycosyltransferase involved in cell wall biosynthesis
MNVLVATDKLSLDGLTPSCVALNLRDGHAHFASRGCRLTFCNLCRNDPGATLLRQAGIPVVETAGPSWSPLNANAMIRAVRETHADAIHAHGYAAANYARLAAWRTGIPAIIHEHAILPFRPHQWIADLLLRNLTTRAIAISKAVASFLVRGRSVPKDRVSIVHNGIDLSRFAEARSVAPIQARQRLGLPESGILVGAAARFRSEKGIDVLIDAFARLAPRHPDWTLVLAGEGPERENLQRQAAPLQKQILFLGFLDDVALFMRAIDLLVVPSRQEGFSYAAMEAMAAAVPVIASNVGGIPEIVRPDLSGVLVPPEDPDALANAMESLLGDPATQASLVEKASESIAPFSIETYADRVVALYREALGG